MTQRVFHFVILRENDRRWKVAPRLLSLVQLHFWLNWPFFLPFSSCCPGRIDIVGFTAMSSQMEPGELVKVLNDLFTRFDLLVERYGLNKVKTIGTLGCELGPIGVYGLAHSLTFLCLRVSSLLPSQVQVLVSHILVYLMHFYMPQSHGL